MRGAQERCQEPRWCQMKSLTVTSISMTTGRALTHSYSQRWDMMPCQAQGRKPNLNSFSKVAEPQFLFGTIKDWFGKHSEKLDTAASNLHFYVQEHHKHTGKCSHGAILISLTLVFPFVGLKLECTASIGPAYWHMNQESCTVMERAPDYTSWMSGAGEGHHRSEYWQAQGPRHWVRWSFGSESVQVNFRAWRLTSPKRIQLLQFSPYKWLHFEFPTSLFFPLKISQAHSEAFLIAL